MTLANESQLQNTRRKLEMLEQQHASLQSQPTENAFVRELTLQSLRRWIKDLKEEILMYECRTASASKSK